MPAPLVAILDAGERSHVRCRETLAAVRLPLVTTWPAFTEAMYLLGDAGGWAAQKALWQMRTTGRLEVSELEAEQIRRSEKLMEKYSDRPMDLADATIVALAEKRALRRIFSLDADFHIYRFRERQHFDVVPS